MPLLGFSFLCEKEKSWLEQNSLLFGAKVLAKGAQNERKEESAYAFCKPLAALDLSSNWVVINPHFLQVPKNQSTFFYLQQEKIWQILQAVGFDGIHFSSLKLSAEVKKVRIDPSKEGVSEPISYLIDPLLGSFLEYEKMVETIKKEGFSLIGNLLPFHTGRGFDFQLALRNYQDYPSLYELIEISEKDWSLLPKIPPSQEGISLSSSDVILLQEKGYPLGSSIPPHYACSNVVEGFDGINRRWIYLYYQTPSQPLLRGLSPFFSSQRVLAGSVLSSIYHEKNSLVQIASVPPMGLDSKYPTEKTLPFSLTYSDLLAQMSRKMGGFSFQKLTLSYPSIQTFLEYGPEFVYDFAGKSAFIHTLLQKRCDLLFYIYRELFSKSFPLYRLIHSLQIEEGLNYNWVDLQQVEEESIFFKNRFQKKKEIRKDLLLQDLALLKEGYPYVAFSDKEIFSTTLGLLASCLNFCDPSQLSCTQRDLLKKLHLLFCFFSALQPGVFSISMWDLVGALPLCKKKDSLSSEIGKGAISLLPKEGDIFYSSTMNVATLYAPLSLQQKDKNSFLQKLKAILKVRKGYHFERASFLGPVKTENPLLFAYLLKLPSTDYLSLIIINFSEKEEKELLALPQLQNVSVIDLFSRKAEKKEPKETSFCLKIPPYEGRAFLLFPKGP